MLSRTHNAFTWVCSQVTTLLNEQLFPPLYRRSFSVDLFVFALHIIECQPINVKQNSKRFIYLRTQKSPRKWRRWLRHTHIHTHTNQLKYKSNQVHFKLRIIVYNRFDSVHTHRLDIRMTIWHWRFDFSLWRSTREGKLTNQLGKWNECYDWPRIESISTWATKHRFVCKINRKVDSSEAYACLPNDVCRGTWYVNVSTCMKDADKWKRKY